MRGCLQLDRLFLFNVSFQLLFLDFHVTSGSDKCNNPDKVFERDEGFVHFFDFVAKFTLNLVDCWPSLGNDDLT